MKNNRRDFLRVTGLGGLGLVSGNLLSCKGSEVITSITPTGPQQFNMSGYAAPKLETVRIDWFGHAGTR